MIKRLLSAGLLSIMMTFPLYLAYAQTDATSLMKKMETIDVVSVKSEFIPNRGQWPKEVLFLGRSNNVDVWITTHGAEFDMYRTDMTMPRTTEERFAFISEKRESKIHRVGQNIRLESSGAPGAVFGINQNAGYRNYFLGNDRSKWTTNVPIFESVQINEMYSGIDAVIQFENGMPRYDFIVKPGSDPANIALKFTGASDVTVDENGSSITLKTSFGDIKSGRITAYQEINGIRSIVPCSFKPNNDSDNLIQFRVGNYNQSYPLVIDPLIYATYLGEKTNDKIASIIADKFGNIIVVGATDAATFPATTGAYDISYNGGLDGYITKFNSALSNIIFSTYIGGGADDQVNSVSLDDNQNIYIGGETASTTFPVPGGWKTQHAGQIDGFVAKISADGSQINYGSFIGGSGVDRVLSVTSNQIGELAVGGETNSPNFSTGGTSLYQKTRQGAFDGFLARFKPTGASVDFSTYFGGSGNDRISCVSYNPGSSYIFYGGECSDPLTQGENTSSGGTFPVPSSWYPSRKPFDNTFNNGVDGFVGNITVNGSFSNEDAQFNSYLGSDLDDRIINLAVGQDNSVLVVGATQMGQKTKFPLQTGASKGGFDIFVVRVKAGGKDLVGTSTFGGSSDDFATAIVPVIDLLTGSAGDYYVAGTTASTNFPTNAIAPIQSPIQPVFGGKTDMFIMRVNSTLGSVYSTYLGGKGDDAATGIIATDRGDFYVAGTTNSDSIGAVSDSYKRKLSGGTDGYIAKIVVTGQIALTAPTTGASFCPGGAAPTNITWTRQDLDPSNEVKIFVTSDGGATWNFIDSTDKTTYGWKIPANAIPANNYRIRIVHYSGLKSESGNFTVLGPASVAEHPSGETICPGEPVTLKAKGSGSGKLAFQWKKNGTAINGARDSIFTITSVQPKDSGEYTVDISNTCFTATSKSAKVIVKPATKITEQPKGATIKEGASYTFTVKNAGLKSTYQWYKDNFLLLNQTSSSYSISSASPGDAGSYTVKIAGECGTDSSVAAILAVEAASGVEEALYVKIRPQIIAQLDGNDVNAIITTLMQGACEVSFSDNSGISIAKNYFGGMPNVQQSMKFNASSLSSGVYWIVVTQNGITSSYKLSIVR